MNTPSTFRTVRLAGDYGKPASPGWRDIDWTRHEHHTTIDGRQVHYLDYGSGEDTVVLIHGMGGRWQHWLENIPALARRSRVVALDLPGFGRSRPPAAPYGLNRFADIAAAVCRRLELGRVVLLGHSLGGPIAVRFAGRHPDQARAVVPVSAAVDVFGNSLGAVRIPRSLRHAPRSMTATCFEVLTAALPAPSGLRQWIAARPVLRRALLWPYFRHPDLMPADVAAVLIDGAGTPGVLPTARAVGRSDVYAGLDRVCCPILAINADNDPISPMARFRVLTKTAAAGSAVILEGTGHMLMMERPDAFNAELNRLLDGLG